MKTELIQQTLRLEGELFKLGRKIDVCSNLNEYSKLKKEESTVRMQLEQYKNCIDVFSKMEALKINGRKRA